MIQVSIERLQMVLDASFSRETSGQPTMWRSDNSSYAHCGSAALVIQHCLGGSIVGAFLPPEWRRKLGIRSHTWNKLPNGQILDATRSQFPPGFPYKDLVDGRLGEMIQADDITEGLLANGPLAERFEILNARVKRTLLSSGLG